MKLFLKRSIVPMVIISLFIMPNIVFSQGIKKAFDKEGGPLATVRDEGGFEEVNLGTVTGRVINTALSFVGLIFLVLMVYAGYLWMTARGEEEQVTKAKKIIQSTIIGLILVMSAYAITVFITSINKPS